MSDTTLDQQRATDALKQIHSLQGKEEEYGHYVSYVSSLPATIIMNGLGQALATLLAKAKGKNEKPYLFLFDHVSSWLSEIIQELKGPPEKLIFRLMQQDQDAYLRAQAEAIAYLFWLKQFARAYLKEKEGQGD